MPVVGVEQDDGAHPVWLGEGEIEGFGTGRVVPDEDYVMEVELIEHRGQVVLAVGGVEARGRAPVGAPAEPVEGNDPPPSRCGIRRS